MAADGTDVWVADSWLGDVIHVDGTSGEVIGEVALGEQEDCGSLIAQAGEPLDPSQA